MYGMLTKSQSVETKMICNKKILAACMFLIYPVIFAEDTFDSDLDDMYHDLGAASGIIIFGERQEEFVNESIEANILSALNGSLSDRRRVIENDLLENAGFRRTGNARFRRTTREEKAMSMLHGITRMLSLGLVQVRESSFFIIEYGRLPDGVFYPFSTVITVSELHNIYPSVRLAMEIEYMLQMKFTNGVLFSGNVHHYTDENINKFETLILELPEFPESIQQLRKRYLNIELPRIRQVLERHRNPSEDHIRALENLRGVIRD